MKRRDFFAATAFAAAGMSHGTEAKEQPAQQQLIELKKYSALWGNKKNRLHHFLEEAAIPAYNRLGIKPVGVFTVRYGQSNPSIYVLLPHNSMESAVTSARRLLEDKEYRQKGEAFLNTSMSDPAYLRIDSSLLLAFSHMPKVEVPDAVKGKSGRVFEMRIYESHNEIMAKKKIEMFNEGGEIVIFRKTGLHPVFFGESIFGTRLPNLTYMVSFESMQQRDANWKQFVSSPEWKELSKKTEYKDTVSNISDLILRPTGYSQI